MRISDWSSDVCSSDLHFVKTVLETRVAKRYAPYEFGEDQTLMRVGYARVSTSDQNPELQLDALRRAGCERVFTEKASGARDDRPELARILEDVLRRSEEHTSELQSLMRSSYAVFCLKKTQEHRS